MIQPPALKKGDTIGTLSLSHALDDEKIEAAGALIRGAGYGFYKHPHTLKRLHRQAGTAKDRVDALHDLIKNPEIDAIMVTSGGNRTLHILDEIDYDLIKNNPKIICGYSDTTALLWAITARTDVVTYHGPDLARLLKADSPTLFSSFEAVTSTGEYTYPMHESHVLKTGTATGTLYGGNLCLMTNLWNTSYVPDLKGALLYVEDECETLWNIDRMFLYMRRMGVFDHINGLIIGGFSDCTDYKAPKPSFGYTLEDIIKEHTQGYEFPVITKAPFGHIGALETMPQGMKAELIADTEISLKLI